MASVGNCFVLFKVKLYRFSYLSRVLVSVEMPKRPSSLYSPASLFAAFVAPVVCWYFDLILRNQTNNKTLKT